MKLYCVDELSMNHRHQTASSRLKNGHILQTQMTAFIFEMFHSSLSLVDVQMQIIFKYA